MTARFRVFQLGSGSSGNLTALEGPEGVVLVDAGFPAREVVRRLEGAGLDRRDVEALVLTHAHLDHSRGAGVLARRLGIPILGAEWTLRNLGGLRGRERLLPIPEDGSFQVAGFRIETHPAPHDIPGTLLLKVEDKVGIATDLGHADDGIGPFLSGLEGLLLEFNHDEEMLRAGPYPPWLKERILSDRGHLANSQAAELLASPGFRPPRKVLWLCHLSEKNNRPSLALASAREGMGNGGALLLVAAPGGDPRPVSF